ncbi:aldose 1-epimerase family protein [Flavobacteriaceae bacterium MHTCC 0001]
MKFQLQNDKLKIEVLKKGAELSRITAVKHNTEFMWDANPDVWGSYAPNLFPIIGTLKDGEFVFENVHYKLPKHGLVRNNDTVELENKTDNSLVFKLVSNQSILEQYPFNFEFHISFTLDNNTIEIEHLVKNCGDNRMYFSVGGHPAFKCPVFKDEVYDDYFLEFEHSENSVSHLLNTENGLMSSRTKPVLNNTNTLPLRHQLFDEDALVFKDLTSRKVALNSKKNGNILSIAFKDFPYLGIWAKPNGDYVCIEPWLGIGDHENTNQNLIEKEGILPLEAGKNFKATYSITINDKHLV